MTRKILLENLFDQAVEAIPFANLQATSITQGEINEDEPEVEYAAEYTFEVGQLLDETLIAGGWIELRRDANGDISITAFCGIARNEE